jgi:thioesterase domain-containing protein
VHLVGHSFGGWIVFELAHLMRESGQLAASLTLLDSEAPESHGALGREYSRTEAIMALVDLFEQAAERSLGIAADRIEALDPVEQLNLLSRRLAQAGLMPRRLQALDLVGMVRTFETSLRTRHRPRQVYRGQVSLVFSSDPKKDQAANEQSFESTTAGWKRWAPNLAVWHGPGNHMTMLRQPQAAELSKWLRSRLQRPR